jgi:uncharacterized protein YwgA
MDRELTNRLAVLTRLVKKAPGTDLGRTAMMKLAYFLTTLRNVPLGYRFTLYSYGPFDSAVLQDVDVASNLGALKSFHRFYPSGSGYSIQPGPSSEEIETLADEFLASHNEDIQWVMEEFGRMTANDLELFSTVVYVDRESNADINEEELAKRVRDVKPHFTSERILSSIRVLESKGLLVSCR